MSEGATFSAVEAKVEAALERLRAGGLVIVVDDEGRENEGDLVGLAERATPEMVNFMITEGRGLVCAPMAPEVADRLALPPMVPEAAETDPFGTAFTVSVDARESTTGISAHERAATLRALARPDAGPDDFLRPGHIFPLRARPGGVLARRGHTEAAVDLARLAGAAPVGVICEILDEDGRPARGAALEAFARRHGLPVLSVEDVVRYRRRVDPLIERVGEAKLPTEAGDFRIIVYRERAGGAEHVALVPEPGAERPGAAPDAEAAGLGGAEGIDPPLVRIHSECLTGDAFGSLRCDCGPQLKAALGRVAAAGRGAVLYLRQEGRGIGLGNKIRAYALQDAGLDTVEANHQLGFPADARDYAVAAEMLVDLGMTKIALLSNNPAKIRGLQVLGIAVVRREPLVVAPGPHNRRYLETKRLRLGHWL
ncbi:MAG: 3,4-dihydroxy-2-butanone 4-phosphate synthase [Hydrogenibacillus schlegelii]|uniref:Riboflavin biosynthesis protein RibBA n=1 Tax=Hydrogenibacillus schlegelii TaxID=1484 RepID=A0A2T5GEA3_HYDSH|nr:3,4-dihydroxy-2-butanone-4-phosphate synthase [Hydrogenibacillus schlegelii]PTQ54517.1 MAG: 3,4-dihydroxy-2-butanone 4-phosphate synthase [Hydrogenibacillus schlegelii]